jgi:16S rRNA (guanine527-N7)-methyltransferase
MSEDRDAALALFPVSRETIERIDAFLDLLQQWQTHTNLVGSSTIPHLWTRHVADSLQLLAIAPHAKHWSDIGRGGGFPGVVLAAATGQDAQVHLVERMGKKAAFLRKALRVVGGAGHVYQSDIRDCGKALPAAVDVITARAVAPLDALLGMAAPWLSNGAKGLFLKGQDVENELKDATISWDFSVQRHLSRTGPGTIVEITDFRGRQPTRMRKS